LPYMNRELRKAIYNKKMYYSKFLKDKIDWVPQDFLEK
jgi:hypothetical protein